MNRPRILFLAPKAPYPLTSGLAMREFHLLRAYSTIAAVDLVFFAQDDAELAEVKHGVSPYCERVRAIPFPPVRPVGSFGRGPAWRLLTSPLLAGILDSPALRQIVAEAAPVTDLIHVGRLPLVSAAESLLTRTRTKPRLILDLDDVESSAQARILRLSPSTRWIYRVFRYADLVRLLAYQRRVVRRFDQVFVCSENDRRRLGQKNVVVVPNGVDVPSELPPMAPDARTLLFCGLLSYRPNEDAVQFFVRSILPAIRHELPDTRLVVVGRAPSAALRALDDGVTVRIEADVPSVAEHYRRAAVAVVPLRMGGGTRIKILEAWSLGVPVVSTSIGCEGLDGIDGEHLLVADTPGRFARACVDLLQRPSRRQALARRGRELVSRQYRWETSTQHALLSMRTLLNLPGSCWPDPRTAGSCRG
jgi:glycosyltransferase involved in cell wall biosynthesis